MPSSVLGASQVIARRGGQAELVADEVVEDGAGVAADGAVRLIGDDEVEVCRRKEGLVFIVEQQRLHGGYDDMGAAPVGTPLLVNHGVEVIGQVGDEGTPGGLVLQFQPVDQEENAGGVAGTQKQLDDRGGDQGLAGAGGHLEQEPVAALPHGLLQGVNGAKLVVPQEAKAVGADVAGAFSLVEPSRFRGVVGPLRQHDVVRANRFINQTLRVGKRLTKGADRFRRGEGGDEVGIAAFQVPEIMQVAVGQHDEPAIQGARIAARLLLADQRLLALRLRLQHHQRETPVVQQQKIGHPPFGSLKVVPQSVQVGRPNGDAVLQADVGRPACVGKEAPAGLRQQGVDPDAGGCFVHAPFDPRAGACSGRTRRRMPATKPARAVPG